MIKIPALVTALMMSFAIATGSVAAQDGNLHLRNLTDKQVVFRIGDEAFTVTLYDSPTADDLLAQLPMTVEAGDYPGYDEKVIRLAAPLTMVGAPAGDDPLIPEVGYYQPGQWIALYYGPIGYWAGKVPLGRIDATVEQLAAIDDGASVTIEALAN
nr:cyclophilin-like fold protein [uncultured Devosia sp.]